MKLCDNCKHEKEKAVKGKEPCYPCIPGTVESRWEPAEPQQPVTDRNVMTAEEYLDNNVLMIGKRFTKDDVEKFMELYAAYVAEIKAKDAFEAGFNASREIAPHYCDGDIEYSFNRWKEEK
jgi:hypothetical protein